MIGGEGAEVAGRSGEGVTKRVFEGSPTSRIGERNGQLTSMQSLAEMSLS